MGTLAPSAQLFGRDEELRLLGGALDRLASGRSVVVLVEGEAGIGKSSLLASVLGDAGDRGIQVVTGRAEEMERSRPFGLLANAFGCSASSPDRRRSAIAGLLATHGESERGPITVTSDPGLQFRAVDAFSDLVEELALSGPIVVGLDDLQWADPSTLLTIAAMSRAMADSVGLVCCFRPAPRTPELTRLLDVLESGGAQGLLVGPLTDAAVLEMVTQTVSAQPTAELQAELRGAAGNPLFIVELLAALREEGLIKTVGDHADLTSSGVPPTLRLTVLRRLSFLPAATLQALRGAAILGSSFSLIDLSIATGRPAAELAAELDEAIRAHVIEDNGTALRFRHDLIRDVIYTDLPADMRRALHRESGHRLGQAGAPVLQVAEQFANGATVGDVEAIGWLTRAAREASTRSPQAASRLLDQAIEILEVGDPHTDDLLAERASSLLWAGRVSEALDACHDLLYHLQDRRLEGPVRICQAHALLAQGQVEAALHELQLAGESALSADDEVAARAWTGFAHVSLGELDLATAVENEAREMAFASGDHLTLSIALSTLATAAAFRGDVHEAGRTADEAVRRADLSPGHVGHRYPVLITRGHILLELDRLDEARAAFATGMRLSTDLGIRWPLASYQMYLALSQFVAGQWDDAVAELEACRSMAAETGETYSSIQAECLLALISLHRNDLGTARRAVDAARTLLAGTGTRLHGQWTDWVFALWLESEGRGAEALDTLAAAWDQCAGKGLVIEYRAFGPDLVRLALANDNRRRAEETTAALESVAEGIHVPSWTGAALHCRGLVADNPKALAEVVEAYAESPRRRERAVACEDAGAAFLRQGDMDRARQYLAQAVETYESMDASRDLARADAVLRQAGIRRGRKRPHAPARVGWESLTPTETTITSLVAEGLSSPQIGERLYISRRTVQTHLSHIFVKLDISSRAELAASVTRRQGYA